MTSSGSRIHSCLRSENLSICMLYKCIGKLSKCEWWSPVPISSSAFSITILAVYLHYYLRNSIVAISSLQKYVVSVGFGVTAYVAEWAFAGQVPLMNFSFVDVVDVAEEDTSHWYLLRFLVVILVISAISHLLPLRVTLLRARCLTIVIVTSPQAAQMAWSWPFPNGFPQIHLSPLTGSIIMCPRLKSFSNPYPRSLLTLTKSWKLYDRGHNVAVHELLSIRDTFFNYETDSCLGSWR